MVLPVAMRRFLKPVAKNPLLQSSSLLWTGGLKLMDVAEQFTGLELAILQRKGGGTLYSAGQAADGYKNIILGKVV